MNDYVIKKVLNNNVVIAGKENNEYILIGKALGYEFSKGTQVPEERIENIFVKQTANMGNNYKRVLESIDNTIVGVSEEIIHLSEKKFKTKLSNAIHVSLPDHINFAIRRIEKGINIENPFLYELKALYPREYEIANEAVDLINEALHVKLPVSEAGFICLHIRASITETDVSEPLAYTKKIGEIIDIISKLMKKNIDNNSLAYARTVTHINFMLERVKSNKTIRNLLLESIKKELYKEYDIAIKVAMKMETLFHVKIPQDEIGYIALHLKRLSDN
ncbi:MAG: transcriptional antiterminator, BglG family [Clostridiaceae bacterium]|nr:transcriptional antiterminator, BglG family [Clostridiaceae bacterium]